MKRKAIVQLIGVAALVTALATGTAFAKGKNGFPSFGQSVHVPAGQTLDEDVICFGCSVTVDGTLDGDIVTFGGGIHVGYNGHVTGDAVAVGGSVELGDATEVAGDAVAVGGQLRRAPTAVVHGEASSTPFHLGIVPPFLFLGLLIVPMLVFGVIAALIAWAVAGAPRIVNVADAMRLHTGPVLLAGLAACIGYAILSRIFELAHGASVILHLVLAIAFFVLAVVGYAGLSYVIGNRVASGSSGAVRVLLGALIVTVIQLVPIVGWVAAVFFLFVALGAAALSGMGTSRDWYQGQMARRATPRATS
jgi:hypothetical protein